MWFESRVMERLEKEEDDLHGMASLYVIGL